MEKCGIWSRRNCKPIIEAGNKGFGGNSSGQRAISGQWRVRGLIAFASLSRARDCIRQNGKTITCRWLRAIIAAIVGENREPWELWETAEAYFWWSISLTLGMMRWENEILSVPKLKYRDIYTYDIMDTHNFNGLRTKDFVIVNNIIRDIKDT